MWDARSGAELCKALEGHEEDVKCVAFSRDGCVLASGSSDCTVRIWDVVAGASVCEVLENHPSRVNCVAFSPDGALVASSSLHGTVLLWKWGKGTAVGNVSELKAGILPEVTFSEDGTKLLSRAHGDEFSVWDVSTKKLLYSDRPGDGTVHLFRDADTQALIDRCGRHFPPKTAGDDPVLYCNGDYDVVMRTGTSEFCLATLPPLWESYFSKTWAYIQEHSLFVAVLEGGVQIRFRLHA